MKILISHDSGAHLYDRIGFQKVLNFAGHDARIWQINSKPAHDMFFEFQPDLFITQLHNINRALFKCILNTPCRVIAKAGHYGTVDSEINVEEYPILIASEQHKEIAKKLKEEDKLDFVFVHYHPNQIPVTMGKWNDLGIKPVGLPNAADLFSYSTGQKQDNLKSDMCFVGGYWGYKAKEIDKRILPLCNPVGKYNIKIFGNSNWSVKQYLGPIEETNVKHLFKSSKLCLDCSEPHSYKWPWDVNERFFKVCAAGGFYFALGYVESLHTDFFDDGIVKWGDGKNLENEIENWLSDNNTRDIISKECQYRVINEHSYFDRVASMFTELNMPHEANQVLMKKQEFLNG